MGFGSLWPDVADEIGIGDLAILWDLGLADTKCGAGSFDVFGRGVTCVDAVGEEPAPFICQATLPEDAVGAVEELPKGAFLAVGGVVASAAM
jgi:hypothetical protein